MRGRALPAVVLVRPPDLRHRGGSGITALDTPPYENGSVGFGWIPLPGRIDFAAEDIPDGNRHCLTLGFCLNLSGLNSFGRGTTEEPSVARSPEGQSVDPRMRPLTT